MLFEDLIGIEPSYVFNCLDNISDQRGWSLDRVADDHVIIIAQGQWRYYTMTLIWNEEARMIQLSCTFELTPPKDSLPRLYHCLNLVNERNIMGGFAFWDSYNLMAYQYTLSLGKLGNIDMDHIGDLLDHALMVCEEYYPSFQSVCWSNISPQHTIAMCLTSTYGRA